VERLAPVIQGTTVELIHQPSDYRPRCRCSAAPTWSNSDAVCCSARVKWPNATFSGSVGISHRRVDLGLM